MTKKIVLFLVGLILFFHNTTGAIAFYTNMPATVVIGQADFASGTANKGGSADASTLANPYDAVMANGKLVISDFSNHRVLIYNSVPTSNNASADVVIGQTSFSGTTANQGGTRAANTLNGPQGIFTDGTKLFITDGINNRVLIFNSIPTSNNASADVVIGQSSFANGSANQGGSAGANTLSSPADVYVYESKLFIADNANHRVLIYNSVPTSNNASADVVIGQTNLTNVSANQGGSAAANTLWFPSSVEVSSGKLLVTELNTGGNGNKRILVFNSIPTSNNASADIVIGQQNFTSSSANQGTTRAANTLNRPTGGFTDSQRMIIVDRINSRALIYPSVFSQPQINIDSLISIPDSRLKVTGSVKIGQRGTYAVQNIKASVNDSGFDDIGDKDNGQNYGVDQTLYKFGYVFSPWTNNNGTKETWEENGYTLKIKTSSYNGEEDSVFYFYPFRLASASENIFKFDVPKAHWQKLKNSVGSFQIQIQKSGSSSWTKLEEEIKLTDSIFDSSTGKVTIKTSNSIPTGVYNVKIVAKDFNEHFQDSNVLSVNSKISIPKSKSKSNIVTDAPKPTTNPEANDTSQLESKNQNEENGFFRKIGGGIRRILNSIKSFLTNLTNN